MKHFTYIFAFGFILMTALQSCLNSSTIVYGDGHLVNKEIEISDYQEIIVEGNAEIIYELKSHKEPYLQICIDENLLPYVDVNIRNGKLLIKNKDNCSVHPSKFKIYTNSRNLLNMNISGAAEVYLKGEVNSRNMHIDLSGAGEVRADSLYCETLKLDVSGAGKVFLSGVSNDATFHLSGAGKINAFDYTLENLTCEISGAGKADVYVSKKFEASISGAGRVNYKGNPADIKENISGAGRVSPAS